MARSKQDEQQRLFAMTEIEREYWEKEMFPAGMDEAGRGPLAGPVVAACVALPPKPLIEWVNDSKKLSPARRQAILVHIREHALFTGVGIVDEKVIDEINILNATKRAFCLAYSDAGGQAGDVLVDALEGLDIPARQHAFIKGDARSYLIAAASILAKETRDALMLEYHELYPQYGFDKHKGYGTAQHIAAIREYGPCPIHRLTFIKKFIGDARDE